MATEPPAAHPACPHCGGARWRVWSVRPKPNRTDRFRKCRACGHLARTTQRIKPPPPR